ncbi:MAG TPA: hypothetical protein VFA81_04070 [Burkholderiales bacterium]|nr:hypothetical protein [Burkholderiales bacterium]
MSRIIAFGLFVDASAIACVVCIALLKLKPSANVILAYAALAGAFVINGCVAIANRTKGFPPAMAPIFPSDQPDYVDTRTAEERQADTEGC